MVSPFLDAQGTQAGGASQSFKVTTTAGNVLLAWAQAAPQFLAFRVAMTVGGGTSNPTAPSALVAVGECRPPGGGAGAPSRAAAGTGLCLGARAASRLPITVSHMRALTCPSPQLCCAGTPAAPVISSARGGASAASIAFSTPPTATSFSIVPVRASTKAAGAAVVKADGGPHDIPLDRGVWNLQVTAISANGAASAAATSAPVVVGTPLAATGVAVQAGTGQATVTFG